MIAWDALTDALDELDTVRAQVRESRARERTARFYDLILARMVGVKRGEIIAKVIELSEGWVLVHWLHDQRAVSLYSSLLSMRQALAVDNEMMLSLMDSSERQVHEPHLVTREDLTDLERQILVGLSHGQSNGEIATNVGRSPITVKNTLTKVFRKLEVQDRLQAGLLARDLDLA